MERPDEKLSKTTIGFGRGNGNIMLVKRDGRLQAFEKDKIYRSLVLAGGYDQLDDQAGQAEVWQAVTDWVAALLLALPQEEHQTSRLAEQVASVLRQLGRVEFGPGLCGLWPQGDNRQG